MSLHNFRTFLALLTPILFVVSFGKRFGFADSSKTVALRIFYQIVSVKIITLLFGLFVGFFRAFFVVKIVAVFIVFEAH